MNTNIKIQGELLLVILLLTFVSVKTFSQEMIKSEVLTTAELNSKFRSLSGDAAFKLLEKDLINKQFVKLKVDRSSYGFTGTFKDPSGKPSGGELYVDAGNKLQRASSFAKCFIKRVLKSCSYGCYEKAKRCQKDYAYLGVSSL